VKKTDDVNNWDSNNVILSPKMKLLLEIRDWSWSILWCVILLFFITNYVCRAYRVEGSSMEPLLKEGERVLANLLIYKVKDIKRGDVVIFHNPSDPKTVFIKRVIGLPGETLRIENGEIFADGQKVRDDFVSAEYRTFETLKSVIVPEGHYFVAGDHRNNSNDSRLWMSDPRLSAFVPEIYVVGRASLVFWPPSKITWIHSF
jgi:signal peptidase I